MFLFFFRMSWTCTWSLPPAMQNHAIRFPITWLMADFGECRLGRTHSKHVWGARWIEGVEKWKDSSDSKGMVRFLTEYDRLRGDKAVDFQIETWLNNHCSSNRTCNKITWLQYLRHKVASFSSSPCLNHPWPLALTSCRSILVLLMEEIMHFFGMYKDRK